MASPASANPNTNRGSDAPYCATHHYEGGFMAYYCTGQTTALIKSVYLVSAGENTTRPGLVRLTGSNGPGTPSTVPATTVTMTVVGPQTDTMTAAPSPGVIAGSVVGGAALGALVTLLVVGSVWFGKRKKARAEAKGTGHDGDAAAAAYAFEHGSQGPDAKNTRAQSTYATGWAWDAGGQAHELHPFTAPGPAIPELPGKPL
jgi:hypothetical protein